MYMTLIGMTQKADASPQLSYETVVTGKGHKFECGIIILTETLFVLTSFVLHLLFRSFYRLDTHGAAEASEARGRNLHSSHVPSVARGDSSLEKYSYSRVKSTPVKTTTEEDGDLIIIIPCGSHSSPLDTVHPTKCATLSMCNQQEEAEAASNVSKGLFWEELESLKGTFSKDVFKEEQ